MAAAYEEESGLETSSSERDRKKKNDGFWYLVLLGLALLLVGFLFLVAGNVVGTIITVALGIGTTVR